jgi:hypothetical protein
MVWVQILVEALISMYFDSIGMLHYGENQRWAVLTVDTNIVKYYRKLYQFAAYKVYKLLPPMHGSHITIIGDEEVPKNKLHLWKRWEGLLIHFRVFPDDVDTNSNAFWVPVYCEAGFVIRNELGLARTPRVPFHLCIGYLQDGKGADYAYESQN